MFKNFINSSVADSTHKSLASKPDCISDGSHNWMCALTSLFVAFKKDIWQQPLKNAWSNLSGRSNPDHITAAAQLTVSTIHLQPLISEADQHGQN